jgi:hypothetical protein
MLPNFLRGPFEDDPAVYFAKLAEVVGGRGLTAYVIAQRAPRCAICTERASIAMGYFRKLTKPRCSR